jgi:hypothetical protein
MEPMMLPSALLTRAKPLIGSLSIRNGTSKTTAAKATAPLIATMV